MRVANYTRACTHTCKNGDYCYFKRLYPVVISNSIPVLEYWHNYPMLKLSSTSCSSALILVHIVFISLIVHILLLHVSQIDSYCMYTGNVRSK